VSRGIWYFIGMSLVWLFKEINQVNLGAKAQLKSLRKVALFTVFRVKLN